LPELRTLAYRAHDPKWSFRPLSGDGAAIHGGRFNPKGTPALYLGLTPMTAIKEAGQGLALKIEPLVLCTYEVACRSVLDLTDPAVLAALGLAPADLACAWFALAAAGKIPPTWALARRLIADDVSAIIAPSLAPGAAADDRNLILWRWNVSDDCRVTVHDPSGRLPADQSSWR
jgi:RES domain-containing protein